MIEEAGDDLFLFSSDYPHPEGGRDPLARVEDSLASAGIDAQERFCWRNFAELIGAEHPAKSSPRLARGR